MGNTCFLNVMFQLIRNINYSNHQFIVGRNIPKQLRKTYLALRKLTDNKLLNHIYLLAIMIKWSKIYEGNKGKFQSITMNEIIW